MQIARILQAVSLMMIIALAASCATGKEYTSKLFTPRSPIVKDTQNYALRFLKLDAFETEQQGEGWVSTDIITGRDTVHSTAVLDNFVKNYQSKLDTSGNATSMELKKVKSSPILTEPLPVARNAKPGEVRNKKVRDK